MIKIENTKVVGWEEAIRGMRNPMNSWAKSDSGWESDYFNTTNYDSRTYVECNGEDSYFLGPNDAGLMMKLRNCGTDHRKFMRMITVYMDITAPLYWWKEYDTYKVGTVANSCSTMHKISANEFTLDDFSHEHLQEDAIAVLELVIHTMNVHRVWFNKESRDDPKIDWWQMIQLLPSSYNQRRTVMLNYEVLANIYKSRKNHKLDEWRTFCEYVKTFPYSELITGKEED